MWTPIIVDTTDYSLENEKPHYVFVEMNEVDSKEFYFKHYMDTTYYVSRNGATPAIENVDVYHVIDGNTKLVCHVYNLERLIEIGYVETPTYGRYTKG